MVTTTPLITIYVRHSAGCKYEGDEFAKRCDCRKWLRWTQDGVRQRRKADTRSWAEAERVKRDLEDQLSGRTADLTQIDTKNIRAAIEVFVTDKRVEGITAEVVAKYERELGRLASFCEGRRTYTVQGITTELLTGYADTWASQYPSTQTRNAVRTRCLGFLRYCHDAQWIPRVPRLTKITCAELPTMPLDGEEYARLLLASETLKTPETPEKVRAVVELMRWSGLAIRDALTLPKSELRQHNGKDRVTTSRQKTGTDVSVVLPPDVAERIRAIRNSGTYLFWDGESDIVKSWTKYVFAPLFKAAEIARGGNMMSHRLRDTFAVYLLEKGVPIEAVAKALGDSVKVTERHYAKWVQGRQTHLDNLITGTWA